MDEYFNKYYLLSLYPKSFKFLFVAVIFVISIIICLFYFKTYDVYKTKGYLVCEKSCKVNVVVDVFESSKLVDINYIKIGDNKYKVNDTSISEVLVDQESRSNYQKIEYQIDNNDNKSNLFYDVVMYYNYEVIINKIINNLIRR